MRSSVFLPFQNLGLVIVDEEHDSSFKQSDRCPYNGRDVAIKKSQIADCPIVLGSATPTTENFYNYALKNKESYYSMKERISGNFPTIELQDVRSNQKYDEHIWPISGESISEIEKAIEKKEQVLVLQMLKRIETLILLRNLNFMM